MRLLQRTYSGTPSPEVSERERRNRALARRAAAESIVLLHNDGVLPLREGIRVVLAGSGAGQTVKGGTGSGDVNERDVVSIHTGMKNAGFVVANESWLADYDVEFASAREGWKDEILEKAGSDRGDPHALFEAYSGTPFERPVGRRLTDQEIAAANTEIAVYVISRNAGEGADRRAEPGDYYLAAAEQEQLTELRTAFGLLVVVLNCGGPIDLTFIDELGVNAIVQLSQPGMEGGNALADVIRGAITPCGKMTDTWARRYEDYPNSATFSHNNGNVAEELYEEGIFVGYRYFDTFGVAPRLPFGFGLSYTDFSVRAINVRVVDDATGEKRVSVQTEVENTGARSGREVVQVYATCPQTRLLKEYQRLCAFGKTPLLTPGQTCTMEITYPLSQMASFSENERAWFLEEGNYLIAVGNSSTANEVVARVHLDRTVHLVHTEPICPLQRDINEISPGTIPERECPERIVDFPILGGTIASQSIEYSGPTPEKMDGRAGKLVESLNREQLLSLTCGDPGKGQGTSSDPNGTPEMIVPGAAGGTSDLASGSPWHLASIVLADGPAGIRLSERYSVTQEGNIVKPDFAASIEHGIFAKPVDVPNARHCHQYCTGMPVGTMLAQSWDTELMKEVGTAIAEEMEEFGITLWLAPGMNIHRNPLCGRNFEYYSEDPLLSGVLAGAITAGIQSRNGCGATIKHLVCNNQEDNRQHSNSIVSERTLREIYLRGFEIAVKHSQPMAVMTSYNLINGTHAANSYDLISKVLRDEWGFAGVVMSDWMTTGAGGSSPVECMKAGNDVIMPGSAEDVELIRGALDATGPGALELKEVKKCVSHLVNIVLQSNQYEDCVSYADQFSTLAPYIECRIL